MGDDRGDPAVGWVLVLLACVVAVMAEVMVDRGERITELEYRIEQIDQHGTLASIPVEEESDD